MLCFNNMSSLYGGLSEDRLSALSEGSRLMVHLTYLCSALTMLLSALPFSSALHTESTHRHHQRVPQRELDPQYWINNAEEDLHRALANSPNTGMARNIILFVGDGMGVSTITAARIFKGQLDNKPGEETKLNFEKLPHIGMSKTYNIDHQIADSAATATAFLCGVKANYGTLGVSGHARRSHCAASRGTNLTCIAAKAQQAGKATGLVTTARVTHATPAPLYAHSVERMWETDSYMPDDAKHEGCTDIASQLMQETGKSLNVVLGGGRKHLTPLSRRDPEYPEKTGTRTDNRDIINEWLDDKQSRGMASKYVWNQSSFEDVDPQTTDYLLGLFEPSHMKFDVDRHNQGGVSEEPSLADMVEKSIRILQKNDNGFFLLVEGARIDHAHHENTARRALEEVVAFDAAVARAMELVNTDDTLMIVTSDHSHPLSIASYARRGNPILGLTDYNEISYSKYSDIDNLPYTTLSYATGPGYQPGPRADLSSVDTESRSYMQASTVPTGIVTHEGSDVPIYATGPMSHLFHSTHEQNYIYHVMTYAACLDDRRHHCRRHHQHPVTSSLSQHHRPSAMKHVADRQYHTEVEYTLHSDASSSSATILTHFFTLLVLRLLL